MIASRGRHTFTRGWARTNWGDATGVFGCQSNWKRSTPAFLYSSSMPQIYVDYFPFFQETTRVGMHTAEAR